ncbi:MAG: LysR family transcriptional regulator [Deltaproteobacteria bacterium]|nr:LysR family transcriptional regulator [Deltaproteobacteria bacterium]
MNWDDLRFVLALARHRTLSRAAKALGATHTTVARRMQGIEAELGSRLFDASAAGYAPTPAGQLVVEAAERTEAELQALEARVLGGDAKLEGKLRVTTMDILFRRYERVFATFIERFPGIELTVACSDNEASLTRRDADVALRMSNDPPEHLVGRRVGRVEFAVYASRRFGRRRRDLPWLHWDERLGARWLDAWLAANAPGARIAMRVDMSSLVLREAIASGIGVHFLATSEGDSDPRLRRIGPVQAAHSRDVWLLTLSELRTASRVRAFMDHFAAEAPAS